MRSADRSRRGFSAQTRRSWLGLLGLGALVACAKGGKGPVSPAEEHQLTGAAAPDFSIPDYRGAGRLSLSEHAGKVVVVDFWATWCDPCKDSFPFYQSLTEKYPEQLVVLAISVDEEPEGIDAFVEETGVKFAVGWDEGQELVRLYEPSKMPTSYIVDRNGIIAHVHAGFRSDDVESITEQLDQLLK